MTGRMMRWRHLHVLLSAAKDDLEEARLSARWRTISMRSSAGRFTNADISNHVIISQSAIEARERSPDPAYSFLLAKML